jgi:hypothetical protein
MPFVIKYEHLLLNYTQVDQIVYEFCSKQFIC